MCGSTDGPLTLIRWGVRSLYLLLFLSCMVVMGRWHEPITITFLGSVFCLILPVLFLMKDENWEVDDERTISFAEVPCLSTAPVESHT